MSSTAPQAPAVDADVARPDAEARAADVPALCARLMASRRGFLVGTASVAGAGVLAACSSSPEAPAAGSTPGTAGAGDGAGGGGGGGEAAGLVAVSDVPVGSAVAATTANGDKIIVAQPSEGTIVAYSAVCTHQGCIVEPQGSELQCPCHGSVFESATGEVTKGPAPSALPTVAVTVKDGQVVEA